MPPVVNPLTFEEHRELGQEILKARARLLQLSSVVGGVYGAQSRVAFQYTKMLEALDRVCLEMQAQAEIDCPGLNAASLYQ
jgi:hypothetical protein